MATYSLIQYDVLKNVMYFKGTPTPDIETYVEDGGFSDEANQDLIQGVTDEGNALIPQTASIYLSNFLTTSIPEINLNNSVTIDFNIEIIDDNTAGKVSIVSVNKDRTKTYAAKDGSSFPSSIVHIIKPGIKYPPLGKCKNCLKFTFETDHTFNFIGNLGGQFNPTFGNGGYVNNQKTYLVTIPDYSNPTPIFTDYIIFWKPGINFSGTDYNGNPITVTGNRWVANPVFNGTNIINSKTFFHVLSGSSAPCPYTSPVSTWYNFFGTDGFFLLEDATPAFAKVCPEFYHYPGDIEWGYNCSDEGCVVAASGSIGQYATLAECQISCSFPGTASGYDCTPNGCVISSGSGMFATLEECELNCTTTPAPTSCSCDPITNLVSNGDFSNGGADWIASPSPYLSGVGGWSFGNNNAGGFIEESFSPEFTSSISLTQTGIFQPSCSYSVCFQAWAPANASSCSISIATGNPNQPAIVLAPGNLTSVPTAFTLNLDPVYTTDLTFYIGLTNPSASLTRIYIDGICVTNTKCPPPTPSSSIEDCLITGSADIYEEIEYDCICPEGYVSDGSGSCIGTALSAFSASAGIYTTNIWLGSGPASSSLAIPGFSINQFNSNIYGALDPNNPNPLIPRYFGIAQPVLYYEWNFNGTGNSSVGNPSPIEANPNKYKTQYTFDILKDSFWYRPDLQGPGNSYDRWVAQLVRNNTAGMPQNTTLGNQRWAGMGTTINVPSPKTYYVGIIGQGAMKIKLDGTTILCTSPSEYYPPNQTTPGYNEIDYPTYAQSLLSRYPTYPSGAYNWPSIQAPFYSLNPYITSSILGAFTDWDFATPGPEYPDFSIPAYNSPGAGKFLSGYNLYIYPVTMSAGCHQIAIEGCPDFFKYCNNLQGGIGGVIFDNTANEIANATSLNDLNIVWDSSYLSPVTESFIGFSGNIPLTQSYYLYSYPLSVTPPSSSYTSWCPTGSTEAVSGSPCLGCLSSGSLVNSVLPCGSCLECVNGILYNGYVVDKGGYTLQGRGPGGIVNIDVADNPINTWIIPGETEWNNLITELNGGTTPSTTTGALGTNAVGGKLKNYTRDLVATCWENPNIGAQTDANASGWAGTAGGRRLPVGTYEGLGFEGIWWSANSNTTSAPLLYTRELKHYSSDVFRNLESKNHGFSIRLCRPVETGETTGDFIPDAYVDNSGTIYDGIVIGDYVWITKNLSDTLYNNALPVVNMVNTTNWSNAISTADPYFAYYNNNTNNTNILVGNYNTFTGQCYEFPTDYIYQKCGTNQYLIQTESGSTTTIGEVQKDSNGDCWSFYGISNGNPNFPASSIINYTGNYFSGSNVIYNDCEECQAIHTIYMSFNTKNC